MQSDNAGGFLKAMSMVAVATGLAIVTINMVIDPYRRFELVTIPGVNAQRNQFPHEARMAKAEAVCRIQPTSVAMGTSRVEVAIDPQHPAWSKVPGPIYNLGLAGSGLNELFLTLQHVVYASPRLRLAVIGLDFDMFNAHREAVIIGTEVLGFDKRRLLSSPSDSCMRKFLHDFDALLGIKALAASFATIRGQMTEKDRRDVNKTTVWMSLYNADGFRDNFDALESRGTKYGYRDIFGTGQETYYTKRVWRPPPEERYCFTRNGQPSTLDVFRELVRFARRSGIDVRFFIHPLHARMMLALQEVGLWPQFEDWKRSLVKILAEEAQENAKTPFPLWDFSGFNSVTTERVPPKGDQTTVVQGFWEPSHPKKQTGDMMLDRILDYRAPSRGVPDDFGILLSPSNIETVLADTRKAGHEYSLAEREEAQLVKRIVNEAMVGSEGSNCGFDMEAVWEGSKAMREGDRARAEAAFARALAIHEAERRRFSELGVPFRESGFEAALQRARGGGEVVPNLADWQAYQSRGNGRASRGNLQGAIDDYTRAIRIGPPNAALHFLRGTTRMRMPDFPGAIEDFEAGLKLDPKNSTLRQLLEGAQQGRTQVRASPSAPVDAAAAVKWQREADDKRARGDLVDAIQDYDEAIKVSPPNTALYYLRGTARLETGDRAGAAEDFAAGLKLDPSNKTLQGLLDRVRADQPRQNKQTVATDPAAAAKLQGQADAKRKQGDLVGAIEDYGEAIRVSPPNTALHYLRGIARLETGDRAGAAEDFSAGLKLDPSNKTLQNLLDTARTDPPRQERQSDATDPAAAAELQRHADAKREQGDLAGAIEDYGEAIKVSPPNTALHYLRGTARLQIGDRIGAAEDFAAGLRLDPTNEALQHLLGRAQLESGSTRRSDYPSR